ncbi:MAG: hypothetical protein JO046_23615 [Solirubrobacterales bacterium]|nr:hypothetical protein [Solirubrobacterales bacterium]
MPEVLVCVVVGGGGGGAACVVVGGGGAACVVVGGGGAACVVVGGGAVCVVVVGGGEAWVVGAAGATVCVVATVAVVWWTTCLWCARRLCAGAGFVLCVVFVDVVDVVGVVGVVWVVAEAAVPWVEVEEEDPQAAATRASNRTAIDRRRYLIGVSQPPGLCGLSSRTPRAQRCFPVLNNRRPHAVHGTDRPPDDDAEWSYPPFWGLATLGARRMWRGRPRLRGMDAERGRIRDRRGGLIRLCSRLRRPRTAGGTDARRRATGPHPAVRAPV